MIKKIKKRIFNAIFEPSYNASRRALREHEQSDDKIKLSVRLIRHQLGSIDLSDREPIRLEGEARETYLARLSSTYEIYKNELDKLLVTQEQYMGRQVEDEKQLMFARGTVNGIMLVMDIFDGYMEEYKAINSGRKPFDKKKLFPEVQ